MRGAEGVIIAQGGAFAGWCLYTTDGTPKYCYNLLGLQRFMIEGDRVLAPGEHQVRVEFAYDGGGLAKGARSRCYVDGDKVGDGRLDATVPMVFSGDETTDVGRDTGTGVSDEYRRRRQRVHRHDPLGTDRHRRKRRRPRPPDHARGALADRDGTPVTRRAPDALGALDTQRGVDRGEWVIQAGQPAALVPRATHIVVANLQARTRASTPADTARGVASAGGVRRIRAILDAGSIPAVSIFSGFWCSALPGAVPTWERYPCRRPARRGPRTRPPSRTVRARSRSAPPRARVRSVPQTSGAGPRRTRARSGRTRQGTVAAGERRLAAPRRREACPLKGRLDHTGGAEAERARLALRWRRQLLPAADDHTGIEKKPLASGIEYWPQRRASGPYGPSLARR